MSNKVIENRYDFVLLFDVTDGNPNGDPDAGNLPRMDVETGMGIITDVCLKRKVRNYVELAKDDTSRYDIFIKEKAVLNNTIGGIYKELIEDGTIETDKKGKPLKEDKAKNTQSAQNAMSDKFYDIRTFGAVMTTGDNAGQVRGPIQMTFSRSIDPVFSQEHSITRMAVTKPEDAEKQGGDNRTMGRKSTIPYGLYRAHGFISPAFASKTGFDEDDLSLFWEALQNMFEIDRSAARGLMGSKRLIVFKHESALGNAPAFKLFDLINVARKDETKPARSYSDYEVTIDKDNLPAGVEIVDMI